MLLLASTSRYRRALLERLSIPFETAAPDFDESAHDDAFETMDDPAFALRLAEGKARSLAGAFPAHLILAADQIATVDAPARTLLHKPGTVDRAVDQLMLLAGKTHVLTTGVVMFEPASGRLETAVDQQRLTMRSYGRAEAAAYVERAKPLDCVGAYRVEDAGITLFQRIEADDVTGIIGLPLLIVCDLLRRFGRLAP
ncbi:MAG: Maf family nucleotide pyrophosphatase [Myxococcota bacterium]